MPCLPIVLICIIVLLYSISNNNYFTYELFVGILITDRDEGMEPRWITALNQSKCTSCGAEKLPLL